MKGPRAWPKGRHRTYTTWPPNWRTYRPEGGECGGSREEALMASMVHMPQKWLEHLWTSKREAEEAG